MKLLWLITFLLSLLSCASTPIAEADHVIHYKNGQIVLLKNDGDCRLIIEGGITKELQPLALADLRSLNSWQCYNKRVLVSSHGGDINAAIAIGNQIRNYGLTTQLHGTCESACGLIYIGGAKRLLDINELPHPGSGLGIHQATSLMPLKRCVTSFVDDPAIWTKMRSYILRMLPEDTAHEFIDQMNQTSCDSVKYLDTNQLLRMKVATSASM
jgi:hypothetical protein